MFRWGLILLIIGILVNNAFAVVIVTSLGSGRYAFVYCNDVGAEYVNDFHISIEGATLVDMGEPGGPPGPDWDGHFTPGGYNADWWTEAPPGGEPIFPDECDTFIITVSPPDAPFGYTWSATQGGTVVDYGDGTILDVKESKISSNRVILAAYPNPFNSELFIEVDSANRISSVSVLDIKGKIIKQIPCDENNQNNFIILHWDGTDENGKQVPSGKYFITTETEKELISLPINYIR